MNNKITDAVQIADAFLIKSQLSEPALWGHLKLSSTKKKPYVFWWSDDIPLVEIPLIDTRQRDVGGYLMVSSDRRLPPIIEYTRTGEPLSHQITNLIQTALHASSIKRRVDKIYFISSTEIIVRLASQTTDTETHFITLPDLRPVSAPKDISISRNPHNTFSAQTLKQLWDILTPGNPGDKPEVVLDNCIPVRYQQNCDRYNLAIASCKLSLGSGNTYCSPRCIAGCVPVAWAMLLSAWKRSRIWGADAIWQNSNCWNIEWPSWGGDWNSSQCPDVERTIWRLHVLMKTTCSGSTEHDDTMAGARIFAEMGLGWRWGNWDNASFDKARTITSAGQPYLFLGQGQWDALLKKRKLLGTPSKVGHGVVVYGYKKANRTVFVCLGWGYSFKDKWINYDQYSQTRCAFVINSSVTSKDNLPMELP